MVLVKVKSTKKIKKKSLLPLGQSVKLTTKKLSEVRPIKTSLHGPMKELVMQPHTSQNLMIRLTLAPVYSGLSLLLLLRPEVLTMNLSLLEKLKKTRR